MGGGGGQALGRQRGEDAGPGRGGEEGREGGMDRVTGFVNFRPMLGQYTYMGS